MRKKVVAARAMHNARADLREQCGVATMYEHVNLTGDKFYNILNAAPALKSRCIVLNGVSKAYSMTGWRIGYAAGPAYIIKAMEILQSQSTSNATSISQVAAEAALSGSQDCIKPMVADRKSVV